MDERAYRYQEIQRRVLDWYAANRRDLAWRDETDPYRILVSEMMLQQTGVGRVGPIYERFLQQFPTFEALAEASRRDVLLAWIGSGYNRRAVNLHECARTVVRDYHGCLPDDPVALRALPGLGPYTVAAVLSFAFHRDVPAVDTNVRRVLGRVVVGHPVAERDLLDMAVRLVPTGRSADWNQALMDLGATLCTATSPRCIWCPVREICAALSDGGETQGGSPRKVAERPERYENSRRFYRGRILAILLELPVGASIAPSSLLDTIKPGWTTDELPWVEGIVRRLAAEGLAEVSEEAGQVRFSAPS